MPPKVREASNASTSGSMTPTLSNSVSDLADRTEREGQEGEGQGEDRLPQSGLTRPDPDSILADEADPETLLGIESESENEGSVAAGSTKGEKRRSKRASTTLATPAAITSEIPSASSGSANQNSSNQTQTQTETETPTQRSFTAASIGLSQAVQQSSQNEAQSLNSSGDPSTWTSIPALRAHILDLTTQVTGLNSKLVSSFERISDLEDDVQELHSRILSSTTKIASLEKEREEHLAALNTGLLVEKAHVSSEMQRMMERVLEETKRRGEAQGEKEKIEAELDELSASLFGEANKMVAVEKLARHRAEEKSKQMEERLKDTEELIGEQANVVADLQRQLEELKKENEQVRLEITDKGIAEESTNQRQEKSNGVVVSTKPINPKSKNRVQIVNCAPLNLQLNTVPYSEFLSFLAHLKKLRRQLAPFYNYPLPSSSSAPSRTSTPPPGSANSSSSHGHGSSLIAFTGSTAYSQGHSGPSTTSPFVAAGVSRHKDYPTLPSNAEQLVSLSSQLSSGISFLKRIVEEDSDSCLRLDFAPGLNWLSRRQAQTSVLDGSLLIEPVWPGGKDPNKNEKLSREIRFKSRNLPPAACSLCGTNVINVPIPGSGDEESSNSTGGKRNSLGSSSHSSTSTSTLALAGSWASSISAVTGNAASSLREYSSGSSSSSSHSTTSTAPTTNTGSSTSIGNEKEKDHLPVTPTSTPPPALTKHRPSIFSSLRLGSTGGSGSKESSPKPTLGSPGLGVDKIDESEAASSEQQEEFSHSPHQLLPIPTHIFRLSDSSSNRYLLCPDHCLLRLRAVCAFWGYLRSLERQIVLEGKRPWEEIERKNGALEREKRRLEEESDARNGKEIGTEDGEDEKNEEKENNEEKEREKKGKEETGGKEVETQPQPRPQSQIKTDQVELLEKAAEAEEGNVTSEDEEDGFADALSTGHEGPTNESNPENSRSSSPVPKVQVQVQVAGTENTADEEKEAEDSTTAENPDKLSVDNESSNNNHGETEGESGLKTPTGSSSSSSSSTSAPPLPRRSEARRAVPAPPVPSKDSSSDANAVHPPALPPRARTPSANTTLSQQQPPTPRSSSVAPVHPTKKSLPFNVEIKSQDGTSLVEPLTWEEKTWLEVTRLKEEMWKARMGMVEIEEEEQEEDEKEDKTEESNGSSDEKTTGVDGGKNERNQPLN